jgi:hypothetical protein
MFISFIGCAQVVGTYVRQRMFVKLHWTGPNVGWHRKNLCANKQIITKGSLFSKWMGTSDSGLSIRVARWFVFKPKIQIWVNFVGSCNGRCWYILWTLGPFYGLLLYFMDIWYSSWKFGIFFPFCYFVRRKIWQPCCRWSSAIEVNALLQLKLMGRYIALETINAAL